MQNLSVLNKKKQGRRPTVAEIERKYEHLLIGNYNMENREDAEVKLLEDLLLDSDDSDYDDAVLNYRVFNFVKRKEEDSGRRTPAIRQITTHMV